MTAEFLARHPSESARVLEKLPAGDVSQFLLGLPSTLAEGVISAMLPGQTAACSEFMTPRQVSRYFEAIPPVTAAAVLRLLSKSRRDEINSSLPEKNRKDIQRHLRFPSTSVGSIMNSRIEVLPENVTVAEASRRVARFSFEVGCAIYVTDTTHRLVGSINPARLLKSNQRDRLSSVMTTRLPSLSARANIVSITGHPAWMKNRQLPVVDRDQTLVGILEFGALQGAGVSSEAEAHSGALENLMALGVFYWIQAARLLVGIFGVVTRGQGGQR
jgi:magnesium transporter